MKFAKPMDPAIEFSIIAGRVSTEDHDRVIETLDALGRQHGDISFEVLLTDRLSDAISARIERDYPHVQLIPCAHDVDLPTMRTIALKQSVGRYVVITEDHCVPADDWLQAAHTTFKEHPAASAVGGCVINGVDDTALDWATFLCEYSAFQPPVHEGETDNLPGMNVAYRREIFADIPDAVLTGGFWETTLHPRLLASAHTFVSSNQIRMFHCKKFSFGLFMRQRFIYSRYFAGIRFPPGAWGKRLLACAACVVLPPLLTVRFLRSTSARNGLNGDTLRAVPYLMAFYLVWAVGEAVGYLFGPADALSRIE